MGITCRNVLLSITQVQQGRQDNLGTNRGLESLREKQQRESQCGPNRAALNKLRPQQPDPRQGPQSSIVMFSGQAEERPLDRVDRMIEQYQGSQQRSRRTLNPTLEKGIGRLPARDAGKAEGIRPGSSREVAVKPRNARLSRRLPVL